MKIRFLLFFTLLFLIGGAQPKTYYSVAFGKDWPNNHHAIGGYVTGNKLIAPSLYAGLGTAFLHFDNTPKFFVPLYANISYLGLRPDKKIFPVLLFQPGYGFYKHEEAGVTTKGGYTFHSSAGIGYPFLFHTRGYLTIGYAHYTFITGEEKNFRNSFGGRVAMVF